MTNIQISCTINESLSTHYLIYKITNNINNKYYIGLHITTNIYDDYMGSGKFILKAESKYGLTAFTKTILFDFDNFEKMDNKEKELVLLSNCWPYDKMSYNLREGGNGKTNLTGENHPMFGKNPLENMTIDAYNARSEKISNRNKTAHSKMTKEDYNNRTEKSRLTNANKTIEEKQIEYHNRHNATIGDKNGMFGNSLTNLLDDNEYNHWIKSLSENNGMHGHSVTDFMTTEAAKQWKDKVSNIWNNMSKEKQDSVKEKRRKAMTGKKWYHMIDNSIELLFNADDIIPNNFIMGRISKSKKI